MKTALVLVVGFVLGAGFVGVMKAATAAAPTADYAREQTQALRDIASELRAGFRECKR